MTRYPLPTLNRSPNSQAHPFPFQISLQTQEFLQAALFYSTFADVAVAEVVSEPGGVARVESRLQERGLNPNIVSQAWSFLEKYREVFKGSVYQHALIQLNSHWDWYIRRLCEFVQFGRAYCQTPALKAEDEKRLRRASRLPIAEQLEVIEVAASISLGLAADEKEELSEMSQARNLGLHNRWEVDADYLRKTKRIGYSLGDLRQIEIPELRKWHSLLVTLLHNSSRETAKMFKTAPDFT
jgi:hypothetical protein